MALDPARYTASERAAYARGVEDGRAEATAQGAPETASAMKTGFLTTEFWVVVATTFFAMAVGGYTIMHPEIELERALGVLAAVVAVAWRYTTDRTELKKVAAEAGTTTIKAPAGSLPSAETLLTVRGNMQRGVQR